MLLFIWKISQKFKPNELEKIKKNVFIYLSISVLSSSTDTLKIRLSLTDTYQFHSGHFIQSHCRVWCQIISEQIDTKSIGASVEFS